MPDDVLSEEAKEERRDLRVRIPVEQKLNLQRLKTLTGKNMGQVVSEALEEYMDPEDIDIPDVVQEYLEKRAPRLPEEFELETRYERTPTAYVDRSGVEEFLGTFFDAIEATWDGGKMSNPPNILVETRGTESGDAAIFVTIRDADIPKEYCEKRMEIYEGKDPGDPLEVLPFARTVVHVQGGAVGCGYTEDDDPRFVARFPTEDPREA